MNSNEIYSLNETIAQALGEMKEELGDRFSLDRVNLAELSRKTHISRSKLRSAQKHGFVIMLNIPELQGPSFRTFKAIDPEHQGRAEIIGLFRYRSPAFRICKATFLCAKPGLSYSKSGVVVYLVC